MAIGTGFLYFYIYIIHSSFAVLWLLVRCRTSVVSVGASVAWSGTLHLDKDDFQVEFTFTV